MRQMKMNGVLKWMAAAAGAVVLIGCSKPSSQETPPAAASAAATQPTPAPSPAASAPAPAVSAPVPAVGAAVPAAGGSNTTAAMPSTEGVVIPPSAEAQDTATQNAEAAQQIADMELAYHSSTDFSTRIDAMYKISDLNSADAVSALGRLFAFEKDPELKTEILDALSDVESQDAGKVAILAAAAGTDQAKDVRQSAIDGLTNIDPERALPILQGMVNDADSDISDAAKDAVEQVKANMAGSP